MQWFFNTCWKINSIPTKILLSIAVSVKKTSPLIPFQLSIFVIEKRRKYLYLTINDRNNNSEAQPLRVYVRKNIRNRNK